MKVFTNKTFTGYWPVGAAAVVVAENNATAAKEFEAVLTQMGLPQLIEPDSMIHLKTNKAQVLILHDGNY